MPSSVGHATTPSGARARAREDAILVAALELLLEVGFDRLSMDAIAERARAGKATIYRHFPDKAALIAAAIARHGETLDAPADTGSLRGDLLDFAECSAQASGFDGGLFTGVLNAARSDAVLARLLKEQMWVAKRAALRTIVERAVGRGELADDGRVDVVSEVCCAVVLHRLVVERAEPDRAFRVRLVDEIALPLLHSGTPTAAEAGARGAPLERAPSGPSRRAARARK